MLMKRIFSIWFVGFGVVTALLAQTDLDRNVTVEREFQPVIQDAGKINRLPEVLNINISKERVEYADFQQLISLDKGFKPLSAVEVIHQRKPPSRDALIRLGMGNYWNTLGNIVIPLVRTNKTRMDLVADHIGTFGEKRHSISNGSFRFNHLFPQYDLYAGMGVRHDYFNYYGSSFFENGDTANLNLFAASMPGLNPIYREQRLERITRSPQDVLLSDLVNAPHFDVLWRFNVHAGLRSLPGEIAHRYAAEVSYDLFSSQNGLQENILRLAYGFDRELSRGRYGISFDLQNMFYRRNNLPAINFWDFYAVFSMNPYYLLETEHWFVRAGFKTTFSFIHGRPFSPSPDITAELKVLPERLSVYGGLTGDYRVSTLSRMYDENPYVFPDLRVKDTYIPLQATLGFKVKVHDNMLIDAFMDYRTIKDQYFFVNKEYKTNELVGVGQTLFTNRFNAIYSDANLFRFGVRTNYNFRNTVNIQVKGTYNGWSVATENFAWMKPALQGELHADWKVNQHITLSSKLYVDGPKYAKLGDLAFRHDPMADLNFGMVYAFNRTFSLFGKLNNVLNNRYQHYYGYKVQGINFLAGGTIAF